MAREVRDKAYYDKTTYGSHTAGRLAEMRVYRLFGLAEPYVEIKAFQTRHTRVGIKKSQVDRWLAKTYVLVGYHRDYGRLTFEQAFDARLLLLFITGRELMEVARLHDVKLRDCYSQKLHKVVCQNYQINHQWVINYLVARDNGSAKSRAWDRKGHDVYGVVPPREKVNLMFPDMFD